MGSHNRARQVDRKRTEGWERENTKADEIEVGSDYVPTKTSFTAGDDDRDKLGPYLGHRDFSLAVL